MNNHLVFVYNAKSDKLNVMIDFAHKIISPSSYDCKLCKLTHGNFGERKQWKDFLQETEIKIDFYHRDIFEEKFDQHFKYPLVLIEKNKSFEEFISSKDLTKFNDLSELISAIKNATY